MTSTYSRIFILFSGNNDFTMKGICFTIIFCFCFLLSFSQHAKNTLAMTVSGKDRISVVKTNVRLAEWHEKAFWPLYDKYLTDATKIYSQTYRSLSDLAKTNKSVDEQDAFDRGWNL